MKKFGTPIGAGPGKASVKVGSAGVGAPPGVRVRALATSAAPVALPRAPATAFCEPLALC